MNSQDNDEILQLKKIIAEQNQKIQSLEKIISHAPCNIYWKNREGKYLGCNQSNLQIIGLQKMDEFCGKDAIQLLGEKFGEEIAAVDEQIMASGKSIILEENWVNKDQEFAIYLSHKIPLFDEAGNVVGLLGASFDITERKKLESELARTKKLAEEQNRISTIYLNNLVANLPENFYWMNKEGRILTANENQAKVFGLTSAELIGKNIYDVAQHLGWDRSIPEAIRKNDLEVMTAKQAKKTEEIVVLNGEKKTYLAHKYPLIDDQGEVIGLFGVGIDITLRKNMEHELLLAKEKAEAADQAKSQFITNMSHDIRTPFSGILGFSKILQKQETDPNKKEMLGYITQSSERLLNLLNEILELAKQNQNMTMLPFKFNFRHSIDQISGVMLAEIKFKNLDFKLNIDNNIPTFLIGDKSKFDRILLNLLSNAIKFTQQGYIAIDVHILNQTQKEILLQIIVEDTGIGIPADKYQTIFEYFSRLEPAYSAIYQGYGLGLYMVKQYINEMRGEITVASHVGKGSTFTLNLPFKLCQNSSIEQHDAEEVSHVEVNASCKKHILLVEDDIIAQKMAQYLLEEEFECVVDIASTGQHALELIEKNYYELILTDIGLPDMDGFTLAERIRAANHYHKNIPIFGLTAHVDHDNLTEEQRSYFNALLSKPLSEEICISILSGLNTQKQLLKV